MSQVIATDCNNNKHFVCKAGENLADNDRVSSYFISEAYYKKIKGQLLLKVEGEKCGWYVLGVKAKRKSLAEYIKAEDEGELKFFLLNLLIKG